MQPNGPKRAIHLFQSALVSFVRLWQIVLFRNLHVLFQVLYFIVLRSIFLRLIDLFEVSRTCVRLSNIASDKSFWRIVDTSLTPFAIIDLRKLLKFFNHRNRMHHESVTPAILESICQRCPKLESFELKHCFVDATKIKLCLLPKPIKHLGIIDCEVINVNTKESYFFNMHTFLPGEDVFAVFILTYLKR